MSAAAAVRLVTTGTRLAEVSLVPEIRLYQADEPFAVWEQTERAVGREGLPPPFWAFAWAGGQALARNILDNPDVVAGQPVLDVAGEGGPCAAPFCDTDRMTSSHAVRARSFGAAAETYERGRPPYPAAALDWLLPTGARRVLDLGAGTGKLTRQLVSRGLDVVAVEPSDGMRAELARIVPGARALAGAAEQIPVDDGTVDVVLVAQAWHWVDPARAVPEVARVLAPGGTFGLLWNVRDERHAWVAELSRLIHQDPAQEQYSTKPRVGPPFGPVERFDVEWSYQLTAAALLDMVASRSYLITAPPERRAAILADVQNLLDTHPELAGRADISLPYVTRCARTRRP